MIDGLIEVAQTNQVEAEDDRASSVAWELKGNLDSSADICAHRLSPLTGPGFNTAVIDVMGANNKFWTVWSMWPS